MKKFFFFAAALVASASMSAQYAHVNLEGYNTESAVAAEVGHVWATTDGGVVNVPFVDTWKAVNTKTDGYALLAVNGEVVSQDTLGIQGQTNGKDVDGGNPATTLQPYASGAALHFEATATGYLTVFHKGSSNKQYVAFEEGEAVGYEYAQLVKVGEAPEAIYYQLKGDEEGFIKEPIMKVEEIVPTTPSGEAIAAKNGLSAMRFPVYEGLEYLFGATGSKMSLLGVYFSEDKDQIAVTKMDGTAPLVLLPGAEVALENTEAAVKATKAVVNGQLVIRRGDKEFNAMGAQL